MKLDDLEDHMVYNKPLSLVWDEMKDSQTLSRLNPNITKKLEEVIIPSDGVKRKLLDEVTGGFLPDEGSEILDGEYTDDEWDDDENENANESKDKDSTSTMVPQSDVLGVACTPENESTPNDSKLKAYLKCLNKIESAITAKKK